MSVTATAMIDQIRILSDIDSATTTVSDTAILRELDNAHEYYYTNLVLSDEGFFETVHTSSVTGGSDALTTPVTTTFWKIELVERVDGTEKQQVFPIRKNDKYKYESKNEIVGVNDRLHYYIEGNAIHLVPAPTGGATDAIEVTIVPAPDILNSATAEMNCPDRYKAPIIYRAIDALDLRLRDGRSPGDVLRDFEKKLENLEEGRQRQGPRRVNLEEDGLYEYDGIYLGG